MHGELRSFIDKHEEITKQIGVSSTTPAKIQDPIDLYVGLWDPIDHLETFKAHIIPHNYVDEIECQALL